MPTVTLSGYGIKHRFFHARELREREAKRETEGKTYLSMTGDARTRAVIPYPLARALAEACLP